MATLGQIRGMLLEEAVLFLLQSTGYAVVLDKDDDPTLDTGPAGMVVLGRGSRHQIDAIADALYSHPFSYPQRLLLEAKCYERRKAGITVTRNALGVLRDVSEYWTTRDDKKGILRKRYHYQYAILSASGFSPDAQNYAFAQDIYLIQFMNSRFFLPILDAIFRVTEQTFGVPEGGSIAIKMGELRTAVRSGLLRRGMFSGNYFDEYPGLRELVSACNHVRFSILVMTDFNFPIFLIPNPENRRTSIPDELWVSIH